MNETHKKNLNSFSAYLEAEGEKLLAQTTDEAQKERIRKALENLRKNRF